MTINKALAEDMGLDEEDVAEIERLHELRNSYYEEMSNGNVDLKHYDSLCTDLEYKLQEAWGFGRNSSFHKFWERPGCCCPKMDNSDRYPTAYYIINGDCPLHGFNTKKEEK